MGSDNTYLIPYLSKELNLLGYSQLPYTKQLEKVEHESHSLKSTSNVEHLEYRNKKGQTGKICYDTNDMLHSLIDICVQLVNDMKLSCHGDGDSDYVDRISFENNNLKKQIVAKKKEMEKKMKIIAEKDENCRQLKFKLNDLEQKIKTLEKEKLKNAKQHQLNEDIMKHQQKKTEKDLFHLHKILYSEKNIIDMNYLPKNFDIVQEKQPDFKKLWSEVKYSSVVKKEDVLKKAICIFQQNNEILVEDNCLLKTLLYYTIEEINLLVKDVCNKLKLPQTKIHWEKIEQIFIAEKSVQIQLYKNSLGKVLNFINQIFNYIDEFSFSVDDNIFLPITDLTDKLKNEVTIGEC